ncbi:bifunctional 4'-phosphopantothenoylcysteine decarboxylase/phosphopantothenoylcysteine synthetase, partial [bacterium]|nr:bifunctional 4'-phosphopantothenoylcysteine decarboxylase/phosphopantothenoylcysteine synthetase [bacterium]
MPRGHVLLLVTGGIAAYKACYLTRLLRQAGFAVKVAMTDAAQHFVTPMTFQVLSENPVATDLWGEGQSHALDHVEYARWADVAVIAPATANVLAKLTHGIADDIVSTLLLAHPGPVIAAPAMNDNMWAHPSTQQNLGTLRAR